MRDFDLPEDLKFSNRSDDEVAQSLAVLVLETCSLINISSASQLCHLMSLAQTVLHLSMPERAIAIGFKFKDIVRAKLDQMLEEQEAPKPNPTSNAILERLEQMLKERNEL